MANFDLIEYQKRVINDLSAENKALKDRIQRYESELISNIFCFFSSGFDAAKNGKDLASAYDDYLKWLKPKLEELGWKGVDGK